MKSSALSRLQMRKDGGLLSRVNPVSCAKVIHRRSPYQEPPSGRSCCHQSKSGISASSLAYALRSPSPLDCYWWRQYLLGKHLNQPVSLMLWQKAMPSVAPSSRNSRNALLCFGIEPFNHEGWRNLSWNDAGNHIVGILSNLRRMAIKPLTMFFSIAPYPSTKFCNRMNDDAGAQEQTPIWDVNKCGRDTNNNAQYQYRRKLHHKLLIIAVPRFSQVAEQPLNRRPLKNPGSNSANGKCRAVMDSDLYPILLGTPSAIIAAGHHQTPDEK